MRWRRRRANGCRGRGRRGAWFWSALDITPFLTNLALWMGFSLPSRYFLLVRLSGIDRPRLGRKGRNERFGLARLGGVCGFSTASDSLVCLIPDHFCVSWCLGVVSRTWSSGLVLLLATIPAPTSMAQDGETGREDRRMEKNKEKEGRSFFTVNDCPVYVFAQPRERLHS